MNAMNSGVKELCARRLARLELLSPLRMRQICVTTGSYRDKPCSGQPLCYNPTRIDQVQELLKEDVREEHTMESLAALPISPSILHKDAKPRGVHVRM